MTRPILVLTDVVRRFESDAGPQTVLDGVTWTLAPGAAVAVVGPSGSGKSTLLALAGALDRPTSGRIELDGEPLADLGDEAAARLRARRIGFVFQDAHLLPQLTALENVLVPALALGPRVASATIERARTLLHRVGLADHAHKRPDQLSGGQRQRVAVVRALVNEPILLLADEPTGSLDRAAAHTLTELLLELNRERHLALVVATHAAHVAASIGTVLALRDGTLHPVEAGTWTTAG